MTMTISFDIIKQRTLEINNLLERLDTKSAEQEAQQLYQEGIQLVAMEASGKPIANGDALLIAHKLNDVIATNGIEHQLPFLRAISKVYRIFLELTWTYSWRQNQMPVHTDTRDKILQSADRMITLLEGHQAEIETQFEYRCAKQAAKCLTPSEKIWNKYLDHLLNLGEAAQGLSVFGIIKAFKTLVIDTGKDWIQGWYPDVQQLRWLSTRIRTVQDFNDIIVSELPRFKEKGGKYTLCLATIFMELIQNPIVEEGVKTRAATGFADLFRLEDRDRVSRFLNHALKKVPIKPVKEAAKKEDCYLLTRALILEYIEKLVKEGRYPHLNLQECVRTLVTAQKQTVHESERKAIQLKLHELGREKAEIQKFIKETKEYLESTRGESRAGEEEEIQQAKEELQKAVEDQESIEQKFRTLESIEPAFEEVYREEQERLAKIESLLSPKA
jgi:hypothetical protein